LLQWLLLLLELDIPIARLHLQRKEEQLQVFEDLQQQQVDLAVVVVDLYVVDQTFTIA
jgi:ABC-type molybdate transport system ATPase subunit